MNRRFFLKVLGLASAGGVVAYSFPKIIISQNTEIISPVGEIFCHSDKLLFKISDTPEYGFGITNYETIEKVYRKACEGSAYPQAYLANQGFLDYMEKMQQIYNV